MTPKKAHTYCFLTSQTNFEKFFSEEEPLNHKDIEDNPP